MNLDKIKEFAYRCMQDDPTGHDFLHAKRVSDLGEKLFLADNLANNKSLNIIIICAYLHDTIDEKLTNNVNYRLIEIENLLNELDLSKNEKNNIIYTIKNMSYAKNIENKHQLSFEGQYVQDADRLDAIGAIGIARAFAYGGFHGRKIYDLDEQINFPTNYNDYRNNKKSTINHFYEKLLKLGDLMNTRSGKEEAIFRTKYMQEFLNEFKNEVNL